MSRQETKKSSAHQQLADHYVQKYKTNRILTCSSCSAGASLNVMIFVSLPYPQSGTVVRQSDETCSCYGNGQNFASAVRQCLVSDASIVTRVRFLSDIFIYLLIFVFVFWTPSILCVILLTSRPLL